MEKITSNDFASPENMRDFIAFYKRLAGQQEPLYRLDDFFGMGGAWVAFRHDDVATILKDPRFLKDMQKLAMQHNKQESAQENTSVGNIVEWMKSMPNMLTVDPPDHTRLRRLASKAFTPHMIEGLCPRIQQIADELLDAVKERGSMDLIADYAYPLPIIVISEMLGIAASDRNQFREWTRTLGEAALDPRQGAAVIATLEEFVQYIKTLLAEKRAHPGNDVTSGLVQAYDEGDKLSENELLSTIWLLITAGHETTVNLIGNGMLALLQHPEQMRLLRDDPSLLPAAVEELLRYAGPVMITSRVAGEDIIMHGKQIRKGEMVVVSLAGANLDPHQHANPEALDITREENEHLAFGKGIHLCLGAPLARLEGQIAFGTLLQRLPNLRLSIEPEQLVYNYSTLRSLASLPVNF
ncbi:cytochrome P450 [Paenibacillus allorhizosphaerae]|uniref:Cytochrome P450 CYP107DY1 n=1 Tax=Paenibacillus allorhizosphaerae TaxID=2849866 RepID=A0ABN7TI04_9BACL|nr:cytochrome P450 [Paenibacillus allorhizosphaerae]CAG7624531.1 Cytochrome P450 CYP107DY1 [Paenibacillus allorhizosphaerae]